jgi:hypothetical protein
VDWDFQYEANQVPEDFTPPFVIDSAFDTSSVSGGFLHLASSAYAGYYILDSGISNSTGWTLEVRVKIISADADSMVIDVADSTYDTYLLFNEGSVSLPYQTGTPTYSMDTTDDYHDYRVTVLGTDVKLYVDGVLRIDATLTATNSSPSQIWWYNGLVGDPASDSYWDYFYYNIDGAYAPVSSPSPSSSTSLSPSASESPSLSPSSSVSPSSSESVSESVSVSLSPSLSISLSTSLSESISTSLSPSVSPSLSVSVSESRSESRSPSVSESVSPSVSVSLSESVSESLSPSISPSFSPSSSESRSTSLSISLSPSLSPSPSSSISASISPSQPPGNGLYSYEALNTLPTTSDELAIPYGSEDDIAVSEDDDIRVPVTGSTTYLMHEFKSENNSNQDSIKITVNLQSTLATTNQTVFLQIWNENSGAWGTVDSSSNKNANKDFNLTYTQSNNQSHYYDDNYTVTFRVFQATGGVSQTLSIDYVAICHIIRYDDKYDTRSDSYIDKYSGRSDSYSDKYSSRNDSYTTKYTRKRC